MASQKMLWTQKPQVLTSSTSMIRKFMKEATGTIRLNLYFLWQGRLLGWETSGDSHIFATRMEEVLSSSPTWSFLFAVEYQYFSWRQPWDSLQVKEASHAGGKFALYLKALAMLPKL